MVKITEKRLAIATTIGWGLIATYWVILALVTKEMLAVAVIVPHVFLTFDTYRNYKRDKAHKEAREKLQDDNIELMKRNAEYRRLLGRSL